MLKKLSPANINTPILNDTLIMNQGHYLNIRYEINKVLHLLLEHSDEHIQHHCERVANVAVQTGVHLGFDDESLYQLETAAIFHDIGEIGVPTEVLLNPNNLSATQYELLKSHTLIGANIAEKLDIPDAHKVAEIIRHHHEHFDGSGYPYGLKADNIPLPSRIICIIDAFDTLMAHHKPSDLEGIKSTLLMMSEKMNHLFDPHVFDIVAKVIKDIYPTGSPLKIINL